MPATEVSPSLSASPLTSGSDTEPESESRFLPLRKLPVFSNGNGLRKEPETERRKSSNGWAREPETETSEKFRSLVDASQEGFIREAVEILIEKGVFESTRRDNRVLEWRHPEDLERIFDFDLRKTPESHQRLLALIKDTIKYSVKIGHPYFINQLYSSVDPYGLVGQWLTDTLNPSGYTYEVSPVFTLMEEKVLSEMRKMVGFHGGSGDGDGIFCPGGSMSNGYAISSARYHKFPQVKTKGLQSLPRLVLYTSADAHYSIKKMASLQGLGSDNVCLIPTDSRGKMDLNELEKSVEATLKDNAVPFLVSATAGTTVLGAYDPIEGIADICKKYDMWLHVDAAWGGGALMSKRYKHLLKGVERADSVTWNPHKLLAAPQQCSTFLTPHKNILSECHSAEAQYLFQKDKFYDMKYDTGDKHVQCGRRVDVLKFWFMWKAKGTDGLEQHVDTIFDNAEYFTRKIRDHPNFELVLSEPECTNICFWYIPPSLQNVKRDEEYYCKLNTVAPKIKERMMKDGTMMVTYQPLDDLPNFFRLVIQSSGLNHSDMDFFVEEIQRLGKDL